LEDLDRLRRAAEHEAEAVLAAIDAVGDSRVDVAQALLRERQCPALGVPVMAVAAVDEGVARGNERDELADRALDRLAGRQGDEDHALAREARAEGGEAFRA